MSEQNREPFGREEFLDKPGIIGARWWQRSLDNAPDEVSRRKAIQGIVVATAVIGGLGMLFAVVGVASSSSSSSDDYRTEPRNSLEMQKEFGWSFGATAEKL